MAAGNVQVYDSAYTTLFQTVAGGGLRQWDDSTAGSIMWVLADATYTPADTHTTTSDIGTSGDAIVGGDGVPIAATDLAVTQSTANTYFLGGSGSPGDATTVHYGTNTTITAKYLIATMPQTANSHSATTDELLFYVELETGSTVSSSAGTFSITMPTNGWFYVNQV